KIKKLSFLLFLAIGITGCSVESVDSTENLLTANAMVAVSAFSITPPAIICAGLPATFSYAAPVRSNLQVRRLVGGEWVQVYHNNKSNNLTESFALNFATAGTYSLRYKNEQGFSEPFTVRVINCNTCDESFSYSTNLDGTYTFTYVPAEDILGAEVVFTFPQSVVVSGYVWENWNGNSS